MSKMRHRPTPEELEAIGAKPEMDKVLDRKADPNCPRCRGTGQVYTPDRSRGGHVCPCTLAVRPDAGKADPKTYAAKMPDGRTVRCTVPASPAVAYEGEPEEVLRDILRDSFSPPAVAVMANALRVQLNSGVPDDAARREVHYLADLLVNLLGGQDGYRRALGEAGL